jgi:hypothetical protein
MSTSCKNSIADNTDDNNNTGDEKFIHFLTTQLFHNDVRALIDEIGRSPLVFIRIFLVLLMDYANEFPNVFAND